MAPPLVLAHDPSSHPHELDLPSKADKTLILLLLLLLISHTASLTHLHRFRSALARI
jgi:hypothetical protein